MTRFLVAAALAPALVLGAYVAVATTATAASASTPANCASRQTFVTDSTGRVTGVLVD